MTAPAVAPPKLPEPRLMGFCSQKRHELCGGAVEAASPPVVKQKVDGRERDVRLDTTTVACSCACHAGQAPQCIRCRYRNIDRPGEVALDTRRCLDVEACLDRCNRRQANNPTHVLLVQVIRDAEVTRAAERARTRPRRGTMTEAQAQAETATETAPRAPRTPRVKEGTCGHCGAQTKGGKFVAGHDAKLKGELQKIAEDTDKRKPERVAAGAEIAARGWDARKGLPDDIAADATALLDKHGAEKVIAGANERRKDRHAQN